ncbi:MAG: flavin reductase family protein [Treponema sp.]|nr:flavin reductase family protein [Treponema sp.]MBR4386580.1 flavin reductase family protein [Treponema sp.]HAM78459.1 flavin oxidoreductase [Treponema sp.]
MKDLGAKTLFFPMPVLIIGTYDKDGKPNAMNAAWGGIADENQIWVCLDKSHATTKNIALTKEATIAFATTETLKASDYVGITSANKVPDKIAKAGLTASKSKNVNAPIFAQYPLTLECRLVKLLDEEKHLFQIVNVVADEKILTADGKVDLEKFRPLIFDCSGHGYYEFGKRAGNAFSDGKDLA